jgi:YebC/PmpR family DNA-binding regulatory protein
MSGHSKWSTIKHKKAKTDSARAKVFTKIIREITIAAKTGGGDASGNPRLRLAIDKAKAANMPNDNIDRAIQKGTGGGEGVVMEEISYEGYGPAGVAVIVEALTDNRNRTAPELRNIFIKNSGNMGEVGCVSWMFKKCGVITFDKDKIDVDKVSMDAIDLGAEDIKEENNNLEIQTLPEKYLKISDALKQKGYEPISSEITMVPQNTVAVKSEDAQKVLKLINALEENDDVQNVYANFDIPDEMLEQLQ